MADSTDKPVLGYQSGTDSASHREQRMAGYGSAVALVWVVVLAAFALAGVAFTLWHLI